MKKCLIIFRGWGSSKNLYNDLEKLFKGYSIFYDVDEKSFNFEDFDEIVCFGWSMGTLDAIEFSDNVEVSKLILLAPTLNFSKTTRPIILKKMIKRLDIDREGCLKDFTLNSFSSKKMALKFWNDNKESILDLPLDELKNGLEKLLNKKIIAKDRGIKTIIILGEKDKIISYENSKEVIDSYKDKSLYSLECGHNLLVENKKEVIEIIKKIGIVKKFDK